jgi:hypothetical protein
MVDALDLAVDIVSSEHEIQKGNCTYPISKSNYF